MPASKAQGRLGAAHAMMLTGNSLLRIVSVGIRSLLTIALAIWLEPSELGVYGLITAALTLTAYFYGLEFHIFAMREISISELAEARYRIRDQFALLVLIYLVSAPLLFFLMAEFGIDAKVLMLIVPLAIAQHAALEFYRVLTRMGQMLSATLCLLIRDVSWVPICFLVRLTTGDLSLAQLLSYWLVGSILSAICGAWLLARRLPRGTRRPIDFAWLRTGLRTGLKMLVGSLAIVALFSVDRMIFALWGSPDELGAYAFFAMACASLQGIFETAILPHYWTQLLEAERQGDQDARGEAQRKLGRVCLLGAVAGWLVAVCAFGLLAAFLPHATYFDNLHLLYLIATAYALLTLANIPHYRLFTSREDNLIIMANVLAFASFLILAALIGLYARSLAVPVALVLACGTLFAVKWGMARQLGKRVHG